MNKSEKIAVITTLKEMAEALNEGAAGPCHYWFLKLEQRILDRANRILQEPTDAD